uniref:Uncharacterized protein n=1 Tax=Manihot esculenta TaxID=3983 RepID=A0A2C9VQN4_MANES
MAFKQYFIILGVLFVMLLLTSQAATRELRPFSSKHFMPNEEKRVQLVGLKAGGGRQRSDDPWDGNY